MILLADSGSTKTDWCIAENNSIQKRISTRGTNPFFQTPDEIEREIASELIPATAGFPIDRIFFYGAGCAFPEKNEIIRAALAAHFPTAAIEINSDMLAAARALCQRSAGIACILGTGSNSCYYDGKQICNNVSPLGFILGDEGSGAVLGRRLVGDCLKNQLPSPLKEKFLERFDLTPATILERVYKRPFPNRFLASLSPFIAENLQIPEIRRIVSEGFTDFFRRNVMQYDRYAELPIHFTGSIAYYYRPILEECAQQMKLRIGTILRAPMEGLVTYHSIDE